MGLEVLCDQMVKLGQRMARNQKADWDSVTSFIELHTRIERTQGQDEDLWDFVYWGETFLKDNLGRVQKVLGGDQSLVLLKQGRAIDQRKRNAPDLVKWGERVVCLAASLSAMKPSDRSRSERDLERILQMVNTNPVAFEKAAPVGESRMDPDYFDNLPRMMKETIRALKNTRLDPVDTPVPGSRRKNKK